MMRPAGLLLLISIFLFSCKQNEKQPIPATASKDTTAKKAVPEEKNEEKPEFTYQWIKKKDWVAKKDSFDGYKHLDILNLLNRVDTTHLKWLDSIIVPNDFSKALKDYSPFPDNVALLKDVNKVIIFSYPAQVFAAYEKGKIVLTGPTNMGRKTKPTPEGLLFTNWKAKKTVSTISDEWILKWNFNIQNKMGVGFHEYALPGYPASHSCLRLLGADAEYLYHWADQWILKNDQLEASGTPVIIFGKYPFGETKPWYKLVENAKALTIPVDSLNAHIQPYLQTILEKQQLRDSVVASESTMR